MQLPGYSPAAVSQCSVAYSHDGTLLAAGCDDDRIYLWNTETQSLVTIIEGHRGP